MDGIKQMIAAGVLQPGDRLPSIRELASELRINPSSAVKAYGELQHEGVIVLDHGRGTFVSEGHHVRHQTQQELLTQAVTALLAHTRMMGLADEDVREELKRQTTDGKQG
jgi:GntR family transcriptional regulator